MKRLLVANRGEIACRIFRTAHRLGIDTVAVHSDVDAGAMHAGLAGQAIALGGDSAQESYLDVDKLLRAARDSGADAVHPGYGFLAENAGFAQAVMDAGIAWVGPAPATIDAMGDKARARVIAREAGLPLLPGSERFEAGRLDGLDAAAQAVGYPLLVKACGGGGGIGMKRLDDSGGLRRAVETTQSLAQRAFGDGGVFLERYIENARHIEIQVFGFGDGRAIHLFERECSLQRRFQKVVEEAPSAALRDEVRSAMASAAVAIAGAQRYAGAGTVEFVYDDDTGSFFFLEMNTRIQVEHPVTEMITGLDLVELQLRLAAGEGLALAQEQVRRRGHAIEMRLYAENPAKNFLPSPGRLDDLVFPDAGEHLRVETGVRQGDAISHWYDPMIAKLVVWGEDRDEAIQRARAAVAATRLTGPASNLPYLAAILRHPAFAVGRTTTSFLATHHAELMAAGVEAAACTP